MVIVIVMGFLNLDLREVTMEMERIVAHHQETTKVSCWSSTDSALQYQYSTVTTALQYYDCLPYITTRSTKHVLVYLSSPSSVQY